MSNLDSSEINLALLALGALILVIGLFAGVMKERFFVSDPMVALLVGVLLSPPVLGLVDLAHWGSPEGILEQGTRIAIAIQVMAVALRLPPRYLFRQWRTLATLLGLVMPLMWLVSGLLVYWILGLPFWVAMLVGAVLTPNDPVVSTAVVTGKVAERYLPERVRHAISAESAANDGLAYPFVLLPVLLLTRPTGEALWHWLTKTILWEVGGAIVLGAIIGYVAGKLLVWSEVKQTSEKASFLAFTIALSLVVLGSVKLMGSDGILAVFVAGIAFDLTVGGHERSEENSVQEIVDRLFTLYIFVLIGLALPWPQWFALGWRGLLLAIAILLLRRLPAVLLIRPFLGQVRQFKDALFIGWFGPLGIAAIFYAFLSLKQTGLEEPWVIGSLVVCLSIMIHGITSTPLAKLYSRYSSQRHSS